jgi:hypothetical protein
LIKYTVPRREADRFGFWLITGILEMKGFKDLLYAERSLLFLFVLVYLLRFAGSQQMGMMPQDAYYYLYSEYLDWSYFDHPPAVAYMLKSTSYVFGQSVGVVKATDFVVSFVGLLAFYYFSTLILSKRKAIYATVFYGVTLQLTVLSMVTTPDVPLMLFWTLSLISIFKATHGGKIYWWALAGMMIGISAGGASGLFAVIKGPQTLFAVQRALNTVSLCLDSGLAGGLVELFQRLDFIQVSISRTCR